MSFWVWLALAGLFLVVEMLTPGFAFLWLAVSAGFVGVLLWLQPALAWQVQVLLFAAVAVASVGTWQWWRRRVPDRSGDPTLNRRAESYLGAEATLLEPTGNGHGRVRIADTTWLADGPPLAAGARVRIVGARGSVLLVTAAEASVDAPAGHDRGSQRPS